MPCHVEARDVGRSYEPVPEGVKLRARRAALMQRPADAELLELVYDSVLDADGMMLPGGTPARLLAFSGGGARLEVKVDTTAPTARRITGWVVPVAATAAGLRTERGTLVLSLDDDGAFC